MGIHGFPSALHYVASRHRKEVATILLAHGADKDAVDEHGKSAFHIAIHASGNGDQNDLSLDFLKMLLPSRLPADSLMRMDSCFSPDLIRKTVDRGADPRFVDPVNGTTVLHEAVDSKLSFECLKMLLELGAVDNVNRESSNGDFPLFLAVAGEDSPIAIIETLLDFGADINAKSSLGQTALSFCVTDVESRATTLEYLLSRGADASVPVIRQEEPITVSRMLIERGALDFLKILANSGFIFKDDVDSSGNTLLHFTCEYELDAIVDIARFLVQHGVPINARNSRGQTALVLLTTFDYCKQGIVMMDTLLSLGSDPDLLPDGYSSLLQLSIVKFADEPIIKWCIGLESSKALGITAKDVPEDGEVLKFVLTDPRFAPVLTAACPLPHRTKSTVLDAMLLKAAELGDADRFELILSHGGSLQARTDRGNTPLSVACTCETVDVSFLALVVDKYGYSVHDREMVAGGSLLHVAACKSTADFLISRGVDESIKDNEGKLWHEVVEWAEEESDEEGGRRR
jgi:ankyrin repeat protein